MKRYTLYLLAISCIACLVASCKKDFLDIKPDKALVVPQTVSDLQALLDNTTVMNLNMPYLGEAGSDDYYLTDNSWTNLFSADNKNSYIWAKDIYEGDPNVLDWVNRYKQVFYANVALEGLDSLRSTEGSNPDFKAAKGSAYFYRGFAFYQLAQIFCKPFTLTAESDPGIPIRVHSDINVKSKRETVADSYRQVISDFRAAVSLLPVTVNIKTRPVKAAGYAMLAKTFLLMKEYDTAKLYADSSLALQSGLLDYNDLDLASPVPFARYNAEVVFHSKIAGTGNFTTSRLLVDTLLYSSYSDNDLRKQLFFKPATGGFTYKCSYDGSSGLFNGIAVDEIYLIRAECNARQDKIGDAINDLNALLKKRFKHEAFTPLTAANMKDALTLILTERRKELVYRCIRWQDLRRLNQEANYAITLTRKINGAVYKLEPNTARYVLPIPDIVVQLTGIEQNQR
jgi:hypothetical protein